MGRIIPCIIENKKCLKPPTRYDLDTKQRDQLSIFGRTTNKTPIKQQRHLNGTEWRHDCGRR